MRYKKRRIAFYPSNSRSKFRNTYNIEQEKSGNMILFSDTLTFSKLLYKIKPNIIRNQFSLNNLLYNDKNKYKFFFYIETAPIFTYSIIVYKCLGKTKVINKLKKLSKYFSAISNTYHGSILKKKPQLFKLCVNINEPINPMQNRMINISNYSQQLPLSIEAENESNSNNEENMNNEYQPVIKHSKTSTSLNVNNSNISDLFKKLLSSSLDVSNFSEKERRINIYSYNKIRTHFSEYGYGSLNSLRSNRKGSKDITKSKNYYSLSTNSLEYISINVYNNSSYAYITNRLYFPIQEYEIYNERNHIVKNDSSITELDNSDLKDMDGSAGPLTEEKHKISEVFINENYDSNLTDKSNTILRKLKEHYLNTEISQIKNESSEIYSNESRNHFLCTEISQTNYIKGNDSQIRSFDKSKTRYLQTENNDVIYLSPKEKYDSKLLTMDSEIHSVNNYDKKCNEIIPHIITIFDIHRDEKLLNISIPSIRSEEVSDNLGNELESILDEEYNNLCTKYVDKVDLHFLGSSKIEGDKFTEESLNTSFKKKELTDKEIAQKLHIDYLLDETNKLNLNYDPIECKIDK